MRKPSSPATSIRSAVSESRRAISLFSMQRGVWLRPAGSEFEQCGRGFDVYQDIGDPAHSVLNFVTNVARDSVRFTHRHFGIDFQMKIDVVFQSGAAGKAFFNADG